MSNQAVWRAVAVACVLACPVWASAAEPYAVYETFAASVFDPAKWSTAERARVVKAGGLNLVQRDWGGTGSDSGALVQSWGDDLAAPGKVTQLKAKLKVNAVESIGCAPNPSLTFPRARLVGTFFNTGVPAPGSYVGDVIVQVRAVRFSNSVDPAGVLRVQGLASLCTSADCSASTLIGSVIDLGTLTLGTSTEVQMEWRKLDKKFVFLRDAGAQTGELPYTVSDAAGPGRPLQSVGTRIDVANCATAPRATGYIDATFDNVSVNSKAKP